MLPNPICAKKDEDHFSSTVTIDYSNDSICQS